ncbi:SIR2 family protein [Carnobacterium maltaromaticum]|uniref:NAD(+) hydrolase ThsA n=1 Tax=Carnobacterium maltaromaticum TaxID=2751 RepID=A0AAW9JPK8_CARML|nr:SIR2 family protein [Carnobacterium maltaromaticum]MDZ5758585.1 SIR2 family protein [Carnobacterium maltaromaticum]
MNRKTFVNKFVDAIEKGNSAIFAGAGLSMSQGYVSWSGLLKESASEIGLDVTKESDLVTVAQYYKNSQGGSRGLIDEMILEEFGKKVKVSRNHEILASLPIDTYWTTNYDHLIEDSLRNVQKTPSVKLNYKQLAKTQPDIDATVYKMHGDIDNVTDTVITRDDYERYDDKTYSLFKETLKGNLLTKTFLFLGFSFTDPNLERILTDIRWVIKDGGRPHYSIMKKVKKSDFEDENGDVDSEKYSYEKIKRELQIIDLKRFSINVLEVDSYDEITDVLNEIKNKYLKKTIYISGSAEVYEPFEKNDAEIYIEKLAYGLVEHKYKIVSGFGKGVGSFVINGVLSNKRKTGQRKIDNTLILKPFPQNSKKEWTEYRKEQISECGVCIFVFGNKYDEKKNIVFADGMEEEFDIAIEQGKIVIPIGYTGYISEKLFSKVLDNFDNYFKLEFKDEFIKIFKNKPNEVRVEKIVNEIISFIKKI